MKCTRRGYDAKQRGMGSEMEGKSIRFGEEERGGKGKSEGNEENRRRRVK